MILLAVGGYLSTRDNNDLDDLAVERSKIEAALLAAKQRLAEENGKLTEFTASLQTAFPMGATIQEEMRKTSKLVAETDFLFKNATGKDPELIFKNPFSNIAINEERKKVNKILADWQKKLNLNYIGSIDEAESAKIREDVAIIKQYVEDLAQILSQLTPTNSNLPQSNIDLFSSELPSVSYVDDSIANIEAAIVIGNNPAPSPAPLPTLPTFEEIAVQEGVVILAQNQVQTLEEELAQVSQPPPLPEPVAPIPEELLPPVEPPPAVNPSPVFITGSRQIDYSQGIIIQPGPPVLIQGTDPF